MISLLAAMAFATELDEVVDKFNFTLATTGDDAVTSVAIDSTNTIVASGFTANALAESGSDSWLASIDSAGLAVWTEIVDGGPVGDGRFDSTDRWNGVAVHPTNDDISVAGVISGNPVNHWTVRSYDPTGVQLWEHSYTDGILSAWQQASAVAVSDLNVYGTGSSYRNDAVLGRWLGFRYDGITGAINLTPTITYDVLGYEFASDTATDVAVHTDGSFVLAGLRGVSDDGGALLADTDWHVRKYDGYGLLVWEDTYAGGTGLYDAATSVAIDDEGSVYVAGYENVGTDNEGGADYDWVVTKYEAAGYYELATVVWRVTSAGPNGGSDQAFAAAIDNEDHVLVGGYQQDATGNAQWRLAQFHNNDGDVDSEKLWDAPSGDGTILGVDYRDFSWVVSGAVSNGTDNDGLIVALEEDSDGDGVGDSNDGCPDDGTKTEALICGCGVPDVDSDLDLTLDCEDDCPTNPDKIEFGQCGCTLTEDDTDGDGSLDCNDNCAEDPTKTAPGICGCNVPDDDTDEDNVRDCDDACSNSEPDVKVDEYGCVPEEPTEDTDATSTDTPSDSGCDCDHAPSSFAWGWLAMLGFMRQRRR